MANIYLMKGNLERWPESDRTAPPPPPPSPEAPDSLPIKIFKFSDQLGIFLSEIFSKDEIFSPILKGNSNEIFNSVFWPMCMDQALMCTAAYISIFKWPSHILFYCIYHAHQENSFWKDDTFPKLLLN
jgi:hypothetical protein